MECSRFYSIIRTGAKTVAIQKVVFCEGTIEEFICDTLKYKLEYLSKLNDGDLDTYKIDGINTNNYDTDTESDAEILLGDNNKKVKETQQLFNTTKKKKDVKV